MLILLVLCGDKPYVRFYFWAVDSVPIGTHWRQFHWPDGFHLSYIQESVRIKGEKLEKKMFLNLSYIVVYSFMVLILQ